MNRAKIAVLTLVAVMGFALPSKSEQRYFYGQHFPNGLAAVDYIYGPSGTFKQVQNVVYIWNYYDFCATANHPFDRNALISYSNGTNQTTTRDANCRLLFDFDNSGEIDVTSGGPAFHEHNGIGTGGQQLGPAFNNFWFDDNWLARFMSIAYVRDEPFGLWNTTGFNRWRIMSGETRDWTPYSPGGNTAFDQLALDGLYYISQGNISRASTLWSRWLSGSGSYYDSENQRYAYPNITDSYHLGLGRVFVSNLIKYGNYSANGRSDLEQHNVDIRSAILSTQETVNGAPAGWITGIGNNGSLMNTETVSANVLGLGAGGRWAFEAGKPPLQTGPNNYFQRTHNVISAVTGLSSPGFMVFGPYGNFPTGPMTVDYYLRAPSPVGNVAVVDIYDSNSGTVLATQTVNASSMRSGRTWNKISLSTNNANANNALEFRVYWTGTTNMDVAFVQVQ